MSNWRAWMALYVFRGQECLSEERDAAERGILGRLRAGESTLEIYRLDR
jgi:hypothetical protein